MENEPKPGPDETNARSAGGKATQFAVLAAIILVGATAILAIASRTGAFAAGFHVGFALLVGVAGSIILGVGLMALSFYSDRSGIDDAVVSPADDDEMR